MESAKLDMEHYGSKIIELKVEIGKAPGEKQMEKIQPELEGLAQTHAAIAALIPDMEANFNRALEDAKWGEAMKEAGVSTPEERAEFIAKAETRLAALLDAELAAVEEERRRR